MLSFDITDKSIRIVKGSESGGKIKVTSAVELELNENLIQNGHVSNSNRLIALLNDAFNKSNLFDKEAIISISSNETVFKELMIPPNPKEVEFMKSVRAELQRQINIDESYSVGYTIVGEPEKDENGELQQKILATACPRDIINTYKDIFQKHQITLKSVMIGCNAITKILLADAKSKAKMPLLAVQIDAGFISLNLYEDSMLSFSRFASIDPDDYDNPDDYIFEAVNENIFRMLQFARIRGSEEIKNVVFYGNVNASPDLYNRLKDDLASNDLDVSPLSVPPQIHGSQNLDFSVYANAIGAMFKRDKLTEYINFIENDTMGMGVAGKVAQDDKSFNLILAGGLGLAVVIVGVAFGIIAVTDGNYKKKTAELRQEIDSPQTAAKLQQYDDLQVMKDAVRAYSDNINSASDAYKSLPLIQASVYEAIDTALETIVGETDGVSEQPEYEIEYSDGTLTIPVTIKSSEELTQKYPSNLVQYLYDNYGEEADTDDENKLFSSIDYSGYTVDEAVGTGNNTMNEIKFELSLTLLPNEAIEIEAPTEEAPAEEAPAE